MADLILPAGTATPVPGTSAGSSYRFVNTTTIPKQGSDVHINATGSVNPLDDLTVVRAGASNDVKATGPLYAWSVNAGMVSVLSLSPSPGGGTAPLSFVVFPVGGGYLGNVAAPAAAASLRFVGTAGDVLLVDGLSLVANAAPTAHAVASGQALSLNAVGVTGPGTLIGS